MPSLRMGYMILPDELCKQMEAAKYIADLHSPILEQLTMAKFIKAGLLDLHIKKMRSLYFKRRNCLIKCLNETFGESVSISGANTGMHLVATFKDVHFDNDILQKIDDMNIQITPISKHYLLVDNHSTLKHPYDNSLIFGYGNTTLESIQEGIKRLHHII